VVFNDLPWNMADIQQAEDRTHRIGQINPVVVHWVVAENSEFDSNLTDIIEQKAKIQKAVTEGKKLTADELNQLQQPVSFKDLIAKKTEVVK
jgi:SNF2 family DNA or RNA helicase